MEELAEDFRKKMENSEGFVEPEDPFGRTAEQ